MAPPPPRRRVRRIPLRWYLVALTAGVLLPALLFVAVLLSRLATQERDTNERRLVYRARALGDAVDAEVRATMRTLDALAAVPSLDRGTDLAAFYTVARRVHETQPSWMGVVLFDASGRPLVNTSLRWGEPLPPPVEPESLARVAQTRRPALGELRRGARNGLWAFAVRVPVVQGSEGRYVLTAVVRPEAIRRVITVGGRTVDGSVRFIVDARGRLVARSDRPEGAGEAADATLVRRMRADAGHYLGALDGTESYVAFRRAPFSGWSVAVAMPRAAVDGPAGRSRLPLLGIGVALLLVSGAGAFFLGRRLSRAIRAAADSADAIARGEEPEATPSSIQELDRLRESLERSSALLRARARERDELLGRTEAARAEAADASRAKDEFLAMLGHELRNPLAPIVTALELMRLRGASDERERRVIERQVQHLARLVDDLLDVSRLTAGRVTLDLQGVELRGVVARAVETAGALVEQRRHRLSVDVPPGLFVRGDPTRLVQVVANLLTNAAKYTDPGGSITVRAAADGDAVELRVADDGIGIGPELLPRVFDTFAQATQALDRAQGGLGLGLAIVKSLVTLHGGTVEARSEGEGRGSEFVVRLPAAGDADDADDAGGLAAPDVSEVRQAARRGAVLLVDDNADAVELLEIALRGAGFDVRAVTDGAAALAVVETFRPDVAVLDIGLPVMDGYELARELRRRRGLERLPLIALTGYGLASDRARSSAAGFDGHLVKPVDLEVIERTLAAVLAK